MNMIMVIELATFVGCWIVAFLLVALLLRLMKRQFHFGVKLFVAAVLAYVAFMYVGPQVSAYPKAVEVVESIKKEHKVFSLIAEMHPEVFKRIEVEARDEFAKGGAFEDYFRVGWMVSGKYIQPLIMGYVVKAPNEAVEKLVAQKIELIEKLRSINPELIYVIEFQNFTPESQKLLLSKEFRLLTDMMLDAQYNVILEAAHSPNLEMNYIQADMDLRGVIEDMAKKHSEQVIDDVFSMNVRALPAEKVIEVVKDFYLGILSLERSGNAFRFLYAAQLQAMQGQ